MNAYKTVFFLSLALLESLSLEAQGLFVVDKTKTVHLHGSASPTEV